LRHRLLTSNYELWFQRSEIFDSYSYPFKRQSISTVSDGKHKLTLSSYVRRRNGVPLGGPGALSKMLYRSLGAGSIAKFWQYWNPIFGYFLGRYIFVPLKRWLPAAVALVITFVFCGALHDAVSMAVRRDIAFLFTPWFFFMGLGVVVSNASKIDYSTYNWPYRALINISYVSICFSAALLVRI
jgi:hypothetical protein